LWRLCGVRTHSGSVVCDGGRPPACFPAVVLLVAPCAFTRSPFVCNRTAQKLSVGAGMCATLAATSAFLEAVNLTLGPAERVPADVKRTLSGVRGTDVVRCVGCAGSMALVGSSMARLGCGATAAMLTDGHCRGLVSPSACFVPLDRLRVCAGGDSGQAMGSCSTGGRAGHSQRGVGRVWQHIDVVCLVASHPLCRSPHPGSWVSMVLRLCFFVESLRRFCRLLWPSWTPLSWLHRARCSVRNHRSRLCGARVCQSGRRRPHPTPQQDFFGTHR